VGLRYDDSEERIIPHVLWAIIDLKELARSASAAARLDYGTPGSVTCGSSGVAVLPSGAHFTCSLQSEGKRRAVSFLIVDQSDPFPMLESIAGGHLNPKAAAIVLETAHRASSGVVPGALVRRWYEDIEQPILNELDPSAKFGEATCPRLTDPQSMTANFCDVDTAYGYMRMGVALDPQKRIGFHWLSVAASRRRLETAGQRFLRRLLAGKGSPARVMVDCGPDKYVTLSLPSVHYCTVNVSDGRAVRLGVEYYDRIEGIHFSMERVPS
jgi:hypothetical protein